MKFFLGVEIVQSEEGIFLSQCKYALEVLECFGMANSNSVKIPVVPGFRMIKDEGGIRVDSTQYKQIVGSLMYLTADLMFMFSLMSRYMVRPTELHTAAIKRVLRYLKGTTELGIG